MRFCLLSNSQNGSATKRLFERLKNKNTPLCNNVHKQFPLNVYRACIKGSNIETEEEREQNRAREIEGGGGERISMMGVEPRPLKSATEP